MFHNEAKILDTKKPTLRVGLFVKLIQASLLETITETELHVIGRQKALSSSKRTIYKFIIKHVNLECRAYSCRS